MTKKHSARRQTFARNLKTALQARRTTGRSSYGESGTPTRESTSQLCRRLGFDDAGYLWVRKITSKGISHVRGKRRDDLDALCQELGIDYLTLWDEPKPPNENLIREQVGDQTASTKMPVVATLNAEHNLDSSSEDVSALPHWSELAIEGILDDLAQAIVERAEREDKPVEDALSEYSDYLFGKLREHVERAEASRQMQDTGIEEFLGEFNCRLGRVQVYKVSRKAKAEVRTQFENLHYKRRINNAARYYVASFEGEMIAFDSTLPLVGRPVRAWREHRLIVMPQFRRMQVGSRLSEFLGEYYLGKGERFYSRTESSDIGMYRDRSPLWRSTVTSCKARTCREQDIYGGIKHESDQARYSHEYVGRNPRHIPRTEPKRDGGALQKDGLIYLSKPFSLLIKKLEIKNTHIERMKAGRQKHAKGFRLVDEELRPIAEKMLQELKHGTLQEIEIQTLSLELSRQAWE